MSSLWRPLLNAHFSNNTCNIKLACRTGIKSNIVWVNRKYFAFASGSKKLETSVCFSQTDLSSGCPWRKVSRVSFFQFYCRIDLLIINFKFKFSITFKSSIFCFRHNFLTPLLFFFLKNILKFVKKLSNILYGRFYKLMGAFVDRMKSKIQDERQAKVQEKWITGNVW